MTCMARMADDSCVIGCIPLGKARIIPSTCAGSLARECSSCVSESTSALVGTSPVSSSQKRPGRGAGGGSG